MIKKSIICILLFIALIFTNAITASIMWTDSEFDGEVEVTGEVSNETYIDREFDGEVNVRVMNWSNWSPYWCIGTAKQSQINNIVISTYNSTAINLTWDVGAGVDKTYIRYGKDEGATSLTEGNLLVNTSNDYYNHSNLTQGTHYLYTFWSYNTTDNMHSYNYNITGNYTNPGQPTDLIASDVSMESITLSWSKGLNSTNTIIYMNDTGETGNPTNNNGTEVVNSTGTSYEVPNLAYNVTYWFTAYSYNVASKLWSLSNISTSETTLASADSPYNFAVGRYNDTQLNLSWSRVNISHSTIVVRKTGSYPTDVNDGTEVYNGSALLYKDVDLTPATKYYYRAWGWNGISVSAGYVSDYNITRPEPPQNFTGDIEGGSVLAMAWDKGTGATKTVIRNNTGSYPELHPGAGYNVTNTSGESHSIEGVSSINYISGWSYASVDGTPIYSLSTPLMWGGLEVNVYKEDESWIAIGNYTVFITNSDATETYMNVSCNNPFRVGVEDVPNGENIIIQIQKQGYKTRSKTMDLFENTWYAINFYLPASSEGSPSGEEGEPWYVNGSDMDNETISSHYIIFVKNNAEEPIEDAIITIKRFINDTANESDYDDYDTILSGYTDGSGQVDADLIPDTVYYVTIAHDDYYTENTFWTPPEISYVEDAYKTFYLTALPEDYPNETTPSDCVTFTGEIEGSTGYVNLSNADGTICGDFNNFTIWIYEINTTTNITSYFDSYNSTNQSIEIEITIDVDNTYHVVAYINHTIFGVFPSSLYLNPVGSPITNISEFDDMFKNIFGDNNQLTWSAIFGLFILLVMLFAFDQKSAGVGIVITGVAMLGFNAWLGLALLTTTVCVFIIIMGILLQWKLNRRYA